ncbi:hypothetical protein [Limihaloglobus sulfuriphilus]|nr:hypothetical protein [Limihaloglobus sulfuriphilus]
MTIYINAFLLAWIGSCVYGIWYFIKIYKSSGEFLLLIGILIIVSMMALPLILMVIALLKVRNMLLMHKIKVHLGQNTLVLYLADDDTFLIPIEQVDCAWRKPSSLILLVYYQEKKYCFSFPKYAFGVKGLNEIQKYLNENHKIILDRVIINQKSLEYNVNKLSLNNRLEFIMSPLPWQRTKRGEVSFNSDVT